jgi:pectin methylesterase-like acyl-CoA thioesterase
MTGTANPSSKSAEDLRKISNSVSAKTAMVPNWISGKQLALLIGIDLHVNIIVVEDSFWKFRSILATVDPTTKSSSTRINYCVIHIKTDDYNDQVTVPTQTTNFIFIGYDALSLLIIGDMSIAETPDMTTFFSASLSKKPQTTWGPFKTFWKRSKYGRRGCLYGLGTGLGFLSHLLNNVQSLFLNPIFTIFKNKKVDVD